MNFFYITNNLIIGSLILAVISGGWRYKGLDMGMKLFWLLSCTSLLSESVAFYAAIKYRNNLGVYVLSSIVSIFITCLYFNYSVPIFRKYGVGIFAGVISVFIGVFCNFFLQSLQNFPSYFLHYQALLIIAMAMFSLAYIFKSLEYLVIKRQPHFWICTVLIFFYSITYFNWTLLEFYAERQEHEIRFLLLSMFLVNFFTNMAAAFIFFFSRKMQEHAT